MGSSISSVRAISFPSPRLLSTNPPDQIQSNELWIYFPVVGPHTGFSYTNSQRGWWVRFDTRRDISNVRGLNGALAINFRPGQATAMNLPQSSGSVLMGTSYPVNISGNLVGLVVPYGNVITDQP